MSTCPVPGEVLSAEVRARIDSWIAKYPEPQKRSAVLAALHDLPPGVVSPEERKDVAGAVEAVGRNGSEISPQ